jgi:haloalkane dehalogenase
MRLREQFRCLTFDFPGGGLSPDEPGHDHSLEASARILEGVIDVLDLQDITMVVHDAGGPIGFLTATRRPERFRALVISNTFGWPLAGYPAVRRCCRSWAVGRSERPTAWPTSWHGLPRAATARDAG